ncbi:MULTISPECIES: trpE operon leader peptide TrpLE [Sinorhizobium]|uniref:TrpE operon leader peptide TrpLE n=1 Tax=Sinorhizobium psoraleae TaxID=520838 RepID=A0ABT4KLZ5_9HYPH|nr:MULTISPECIES: trpE operon leader peptide TrpLE [Sinorhizobium]MCA1442824.1 trpE operon leader peptide TrpLE [Ensifer sp. IC4062]MCZ4091947.1 trpE operon leader peptide TrpLE [Sinorhizobium psoraleae]MDK1387232.1 trpE operon leader peptide TrpLE [Sinorhizobium sp. 7-81]
MMNARNISIWWWAR